MTDFKDKIISELEVLHAVAPLETAGTFKARAYATAIKTIAALPRVATAEDLPAPAKGDGLGKEIRSKILTILEHGHLEIEDEIRTKAAALTAFRGIYGVGPKKAEELVAAGYFTISAVRAAAAANPKLLNKNQHVGLKYYEDINSRIPREEMEKHEIVLMTLMSLDLGGTIVGSYRRGRPDSGDIDMLVRVPDVSVDAGKALADYVEKLKGRGYIREVLAHGDHKCLAVAALPGRPARRLDLLVTPPAEFPFAVLYFTGSDGFNVAMRAHALTRGFTLNEHALTQVSTGRPVGGIKTEQDIFKALKLQWREPEERTGAEACVAI